jgi:5-methylcytosine-specific restriction endonuclease McrA
MAKKHRSPPEVMKQRDVEKRLRLLREWDFLCILCGHPFENLESITVEHLMPRSLAPKHAHQNKAPTHYN